jgi:hypothetical protein
VGISTISWKIDMLQWAGLAAILNEIYPGFADHFTDKVKNKVTVPLKATYRMGWTNGFIAGTFTGIAISVATRYAYVKYFRTNRDVNQR